MEDMLSIYANAALKQTKAALWDTMGWNWYLMMAKDDPATNDGKLAVWKKNIDVAHAGWTGKYRQYAKAGGIYANYSETEAREREDSTFVADMDAWENVRLRRVERIDGILKFFTDKNDTFEMDVRDIYSQTEFRQAFTLGTTIILPAIKITSYQRFIESLKITKVEHIGATLLEKIEEILETQKSRLKDTEVENEDEALESVESRSFAFFNGCLYFRVHALLNEIKRLYPNIKLSSLFAMLRDMGAENKKHRKFNFWKYDMATEHS